MHSKCETRESEKYTIIFSKCNSRLFSAILIMWLLSVALGFSISYSSPAIENMNAHQNPFHLSTEEKSWVGSALGIGFIFGGLVNGVSNDWFGRHCTLMLGVPLLTIGCVTIAASMNLTTLIIGRIISGYGVSTFTLTIPIYLSEIVPCHMRGMVMAGYAMSQNVGMVMVYACGSVLPWTWLSIICACILTVAMLYLPFLPETPHWLLMDGYKDASLQSLMWVRGYENVHEELREIAAKIQQTKTAKAGIRDLTDPRIYKPLLISSGLCVLQIFSGIDFAMFYTVTIFSTARNDIDPYLQTILFGLAGALGNILAMVSLDKLGRRYSLLSSAFMAALSMATLGIYFKVKDEHALFATEKLFWLPLAGLLLFIMSYSFGLGPIPATMSVELLPARARGIGGSILITVVGVSMFLETKFSLSLTETWIHTYGVFWGFSVILFIGAIFAYFYVPETKGKTLEAIEELFE